MKLVFKLLAFASLAVCLTAPFLHFRGDLTADGYKNIFLAGSLAWFIFAPLWAQRAWQKPD